jgi:hypothetical protein
MADITGESVPFVPAWTGIPIPATITTMHRMNMILRAKCPVGLTMFSNIQKNDGWRIPSIPSPAFLRLATHNFERHCIGTFIPRIEKLKF